MRFDTARSPWLVELEDCGSGLKDGELQQKDCAPWLKDCGSLLKDYLVAKVCQGKVWYDRLNNRVLLPKGIDDRVRSTINFVLLRTLIASTIQILILTNLLLVGF